jgi:hypothetical protein
MPEPVDSILITIVIVQVAQVITCIRGHVILIKLDSSVNLTVLNLPTLLHAPTDDGVVCGWHMDVLGHNFAAIEM